MSNTRNDFASKRTLVEICSLVLANRLLRLAQFQPRNDDICQALSEI